MIEPRIGILGPGRVGAAFAQRAAEVGLRVVACVGRDRDRSRVVFESFGGAAGDPTRDPSEWRTLAFADVVLVTVGDADLAAAIDEVVRRAVVAPRSLWLHTSGLHACAVLAPLRAIGARTAALHPLCAIPDPAAGARALVGAIASIDAAAEDVAAVREFAERIGLRPMVLAAVEDRRVYHAACTLAANGASALHDLATELFVSQGMEPLAARTAAADLAARSIALCAASGARDALSGPVARGDVAAVEAHLAALAASGAVDARRAYVALSTRAVELARQRGRLDRSTLAALRSALTRPEAHD